MTKNAPLLSVADAQSHFVSDGSNRIHYVTAGQGQHTLVLVHGWACHLGFWREQIPALADRARLLLVDLPGHGQSSKPEANYTMDFFAGAVLAVLRDAKVNRATFIGHSMGAAVLCRVHHHEPELVSGLVSVDGLLCRLAGSPEEAQALAGGFATPHYLDHARDFISSLFPVAGTEALRDRVTAEMLLTPQLVMHSAMVGMLDPGQPDWRLQRVNAPVIVINAPTPWWNKAYEDYACSLSPQSEYVRMKGVGHFLMLEQPAEFNALLTARLKKFDLIAA